MNSNSFFKSFSSSNFIESNKSNSEMRDLIYRPTFEMIFLKSLVNTSSLRFNKLNRDEGVFNKSNLGIEKPFDTSNASRFQSFNFPLFSHNMYMHNDIRNFNIKDISDSIIQPLSEQNSKTKGSTMQNMF